jgi:hypothetical protein
MLQHKIIKRNIIPLINKHCKIFIEIEYLLLNFLTN